MSKAAAAVVCALVFAGSLSSRDKQKKVTYHEMAVGMRDAFNCGLVIEQRLHGPLKDNDELYKKQRGTYNCDYVESVLNTLTDQTGEPPKQ